ncbi:glycosyltransferase family 2 protein [Pontibacter locisalis]|uniref:Glycosyltransferase family 2 protein n=1 Tax=Pontibacter locisalis TaxID=1719035 RepID=A0ABW5IPD7_9BACT
MQNFPLYHIAHIDLSRTLKLPALDTDHQGNYIVFWWQNVALGHLFLETGENLSPADYLERVIKSIEPTICFYAKETGSPESKWQLWLRNQQFETWSDWIERSFSGLTSAAIPPTVPVSVIVCTHNRPRQLQQCLENLKLLSTLPEEIIVVDNAPSDEASLKVVRQYQDLLQIVYVKESRKGLDIARNTGIKNASTPVVAFVDDDVATHPLWLYQVWESFKDPLVAAMTGLVIASELKTEAQCIFEKHWSFNRGYTDKLYDQGFFNDTLRKGPPVWRIGAGANMAFRREVFEQTGCFHELLDAGAAGCSGDSEMWYRLLMHGYKIHYNPRAIVFHEHRKETEALKRQIFYYMRGHTAAALIQQHYYQKADYSRYLAKLFLKTYTRSIIKGFPGYSFKYSTLWAQISGALAGLAYYYKNRKKSTGELVK